MPFKKGQSGNPKGRKKRADEFKLLDIITQAGREALGTETPFEDLWEKIWLEANMGSKDHQRFVLEYTYGKPKQQLEAKVTGDTAPTLIFNPVMPDAGDKA